MVLCSIPETHAASGAGAHRPDYLPGLGAATRGSSQKAKSPAMLAASRTSFQMAVSRAARSKAAGSASAAAAASGPVGQCSTQWTQQSSSGSAWGQVAAVQSLSAPGRAGIADMDAVTRWTSPEDLEPPLRSLGEAKSYRHWLQGASRTHHQATGRGRAHQQGPSRRQCWPRSSR